MHLKSTSGYAQGTKDPFPSKRRGPKMLKTEDLGADGSLDLTPTSGLIMPLNDISSVILYKINKVCSRACLKICIQKYFDVKLYKRGFG